MSENEQNDAQEAVSDAKVPADAMEAVDAQESDSGPGREAAKYRRRLRETEAERDGLAGQLEAMRRGEIERIAGEHLRQPAGLWSTGAEVAPMLGEDGTVDAEAVAQACSTAVETHGLESAQAALLRGNHVPTEGGNAPGRPSGDPFVEAFKPRR